MKPSIGRIVIYNTSEQDRIEMQKTGNVQMQLPAIIVAVWSDTCVNLKVITDGQNEMWKTSVTMGTDEYSWSWPVIN